MTEWEGNEKQAKTEIQEEENAVRVSVRAGQQNPGATEKLCNNPAQVVP